jgi:hypothetical protein
VLNIESILLVIRRGSKYFNINVFFLLIKQIVEEAGGTVSRMDGGKFCVFDRSVLVSNGVLHAKVRLHCLFPMTKLSIVLSLFSPFFECRHETNGMKILTKWKGIRGKYI